MAEHTASVEVAAPVHQVYEMWSHFTDYPQFMSHVKDVSYIDDQRSRWVVDIMGRHEWEATNEDWIQDRQIGWRSTAGLRNRGRVTFEQSGPDATRVTVWLEYDPPAGALGEAGEALGGGATLRRQLHHDLVRFAEMVREAPAGSLDPQSSAYLFHAESASGRALEQEQRARTFVGDVPSRPSSNLLDEPGAPGMTERGTSALDREDPNYDAGGAGTTRLPT